MEINFRNWIEDQMQGPQGPQGPQAKQPMDPKMKQAAANVLKAAQAAAAKGGNPVQAMQQQALAMAQAGQVDIKKLGQITPTES